jgi:hypothetical protein
MHKKCIATDEKSRIRIRIHMKTLRIWNTGKKKTEVSPGPRILMSITQDFEINNYFRKKIMRTTETQIERKKKTRRH